MLATLKWYQKKWINICIVLILLIGLNYFFLPMRFGVREKLNLNEIVKVDVLFMGMSEEGEPIDNRWSFEDEKAKEVARSIVEDISNSRVIKRFKDYTNSDLYSITIRDNKKTYIIGVSEDMITIGDLEHSRRYTIIGKRDLPKKISDTLDKALLGELRIVDISNS
ncbi:MAG: hypothetical protein RSG75_06105 [Cellulosilyticaceae bacterium]